MCESPRYLVRPPLRCFELDPSRPAGVCARPARWSAPLSLRGELAFYCDDHRPMRAAPVSLDALFRRVSITADVLFSGTSFDRARAHAEALAQLEYAVEAAGGLLNLHVCRSEVGRLELAGGPSGRAPARQGV